MVVQDLLFTESLIETDEGRVLSFLPPSYLQTDNHLKLNPVIYSKPKQFWMNIATTPGRQGNMSSGRYSPG